MKKQADLKGILYIVATPIGNLHDITLRALEVLNQSDGIICEGFRSASTLLKKLEIKNKNLTLLDEHNEKTQSDEILSMLLSGQQLALISDCGTPAFQDPGSHLIARCHELGIQVISIPGPSSLMTALSLSPLPIKEFYFAGFLPQKKPDRLRKLMSIKKLQLPIILMDTPYRLKKLLCEVSEHFGSNTMVALALDLTLPEEELFFDRIGEIIKRVQDRKGEFILIVY